MGVFPPGCGTRARNQCLCMKDCLTNHDYAEYARKHGRLFEASSYKNSFLMHRQCQFVATFNQESYWGTTDTTGGGPRVPNTLNDEPPTEEILF